MTERPEQGMAEVAAPEELAAVEAEVEEQLEELEVDAPRVAIVMGSESDRETMSKAEAELEKRGISFEVRVMSAHRQPASAWRSPGRACRRRCPAWWRRTPSCPSSASR